MSVLDSQGLARYDRKIKQKIQDEVSAKAVPLLLIKSLTSEIKLEVDDTSQLAADAFNRPPVEADVGTRGNGIVLIGTKAPWIAINLITWEVTSVAEDGTVTVTLVNVEAFSASVSAQEACERDFGSI